ncbi:ATP synthase F1 subunit epsilon [Candidatus Nomurabacteria bacterium]|nr:ATP synthase F1 subunit epsilon [Candidatus Nomurabacteria bacterium]
MLLTLATTEGILYEDTVSEVTIPTLEGEITILSQHIPLVSVLRPGEMRVVKDGSATHFVIGGGVLEMRPDNTLMILSDDSIASADIDAEASRAAYERAQTTLAHREQLTEEEIKEYESIMFTNFNRMKAGTRFK